VVQAGLDLTLANQPVAGAASAWAPTAVWACSSSHRRGLRPPERPPDKSLTVPSAAPCLATTLALVKPGGRERATCQAGG